MFLTGSTPALENMTAEGSTRYVAVKTVAVAVGIVTLVPDGASASASASANASASAGRGEQRDNQDVQSVSLSDTGVPAVLNSAILDLEGEATNIIASSTPYHVKNLGSCNIDMLSRVIRSDFASSKTFQSSIAESITTFENSSANLLLVDNLGRSWVVKAFEKFIDPATCRDISGHHACISFSSEKGVWVFQDTSLAGSFVNETFIHGTVGVIGHGDFIRLGTGESEIYFVVHLVPGVSHESCTPTIASLLDMLRFSRLLAFSTWDDQSFSQTTKNLQDYISRTTRRSVMTPDGSLIDVKEKNVDVDIKERIDRKSRGSQFWRDHPQQGKESIGRLYESLLNRPSHLNSTNGVHAIDQHMFPISQTPQNLHGTRNQTQEETLLLESTPSKDSPSRNIAMITYNGSIVWSPLNIAADHRSPQTDRYRPAPQQERISKRVEPRVPTDDEISEWLARSKKVGERSSSLIIRELKDLRRSATNEAEKVIEEAKREAEQLRARAREEATLLRLQAQEHADKLKMTAETISRNAVSLEQDTVMRSSRLEDFVANFQPNVPRRHDRDHMLLDNHVEAPDPMAADVADILRNFDASMLNGRQAAVAPSAHLAPPRGSREAQGYEVSATATRKSQEESSQHLSRGGQDQDAARGLRRSDGLTVNTMRQSNSLESVPRSSFLSALQGTSHSHQEVVPDSDTPPPPLSHQRQGNTDGGDRESLVQFSDPYGNRNTFQSLNSEIYGDQAEEILELEAERERILQELARTVADTRMSYAV
eukprot:763837-Hanusia_phi.AAC.10